MAFWVFIDWLTTFLLTFFATYLIFNKRHQVHYKLITAFILLLSLSYVQFLLRIYYEVEFISDIKFLKHSDTAIFFLLNPIIYFYAISLLNSDFRFKKSHIMHIIPFLFFLFLPCLNSYIKAKYNFETLYIVQIVVVSFFIQIVLYQGRALWYISNYKNTLRAIDNTDDEHKIKWLKVIIISLMVLWTLRFIYIFHFVISDFKIPYLFTATKIISLIVYSGIIYTGLHFGKVFSMPQMQNKYYYSNLPEQEKDRILKILQEYMSSEKPFLNSEITLEIIAYSLDFKPRHLSQIINEKLGKNFKEYINNYRLEESISQLKNKKLQAKTILEILYDSGFNSKSSFYSLFEKHFDQSPTQFRNSFLEKQ